MENNIDNIQIGDYTLKEWEEQAKAPSVSSTVSFNDAEGLGLMQPEPQGQEGNNTNKFYDTLDAVGIEHPDADKKYEKLNALDTTIDVTRSLFTEASHIFAPKDRELQYESRTHFGENVKYGYRYIAGTAGFIFGGEVLAGLKGLGFLGKILSGAGKVLSGSKLIKTGSKATKAAKIGTAIANASLGGATAGALADFTLYRPEENEGHLVDAFGATDNALISYLQTKDTDTDINAKLKNVVEGLVMGMGIGNIIEFGAKPLFKNALKNLKAFKDGKKGALEAIVQDQINLERFASKADLLETVENIKAEAEANGTEASQMLIDRLHPSDNPEAQQMLKVLNEGDEIFVHSDGTWDISVNKWDDAYKVSPEEYKKQLLARDMAQDGYAGDTAISHQDTAVKETWTNRGWIGENEELTKTNANKIAKHYKDKFEIDNNIKVEFVDGLTIKGQAVEGNTQATKNLGKSIKPKQNVIDKKKLQISKIEDKITMAESGNKEVKNSLDNLKEELKIAKNELKQLEKEAKGKNKIPNITIQIDMNAKNPYATLRSELEHARDIAKGEIPNQTEKHFSRYNGLNEGEVAPEYVYKKAQGKNKALNGIQETMPETTAKPLDSEIKENLVKPQQLKIDFNSTIETKQSTGDIVTSIINGEVKPATKADIENLVSKVEKLNPEISGFKWKNLTEDSEAFTKKLQEIFDEDDVSGLLEALAKGDIDNLEYIVRKEMAAVNILNTLAEAGKKMGTDAPIEAKEAIISTIRHTSEYITGIKSGFGSGLNSQKPINSLLESYGASRLSSWTKEGIRTFSQALIDEVNDIISLNFTRGEKLTPQTMGQDLIRRLLEREDTRDFVSFLLQNDEMKADYVKEIQKLLANPKTANIDSMAESLTRLINSAEYNSIFKASQLAPDKKSFYKTVADWCDKQGGITSYYVHNLLSGVGSLAKNIGSGAVNTVYFPARKILASLDPFIDQTTRESLGAEGYRTYKCMLQSWAESWQLMKEAFITGNGKLTDIGENTLNITDGKFQGYHELQKIDYYFQDPSKFWEGMQNLHSVMTRAMGATDEFMSQLNYRSIARSKALQEAEKNAIEAGMKDNELWINEEADRIFKNKFDNHGKPTDVESLNEARTILYQNNLDGTMYNYQTGAKEQMRDPSFVMKLAGSLQGMANENAFMKCMFPFVKTGANILQMSLDHNAIYMAASPLQRKLLTAQTAEGALARSQCAFGMFSLAIGAMMAFNGMITGSAPSDPKERKALFATGWKPYSFKVGDSYISYQGYEPLHGMLGFAADCANMYSTITNPEDEARLKHFQAQILPTLVNNFLDKAAFRTGLSQLDLVLNPQDADEWNRAIAQTTKGFLPDVAFVTNTKSVGEHDVLQPKTFYERVFYRYFPEKWTPMDYRRNVFGEKQSITGLIATTMGNQEGTPEEEALEYLSRYGYTPSEIDDVIANTGLRISDFKDSETGRSAMDAMKEEMSTVTIQGMTLREAIRTLVTSEAYQSLPDGVDLDTGARWGASVDTKINAINDIFLIYKQRAKKNIIDNSEYFINSQGRTIHEASEDIKLKRLQQLNNLY